MERMKENVSKDEIGSLKCLHNKFKSLLAPAAEQIIYQEDG
jgi:hypothetical protein